MVIAIVIILFLIAQGILFFGAILILAILRKIFPRFIIPQRGNYNDMDDSSIFDDYRAFDDNDPANSSLPGNIYHDINI